MAIFISYFKDFFKSIHPALLIFCFTYAAIIIFLNYRFQIEPKIIVNLPDRFQRFVGFYIIYFCAFFIPYVVLVLLKSGEIDNFKGLLALIILAPAIFALKVSFGGLSQLFESSLKAPWGRFYGMVINLPSRLVLVVIPLLLIWWLGKYKSPLFGATLQGFSWRPYMMMLLIMIPLVAWASTQNDFLHTYPKLKQVAFIESHSRLPWLSKLFFELAYGMDFITIELFFRGFLVLAFVRYAGQEAVLPAAVFYCSIHFGKPLAECISSFFGGMILGILVYRTGSIAGGLMVHLGIAWMMEAGGYFGNLLKHR